MAMTRGGASEGIGKQRPTTLLRRRNYAKGIGAKGNEQQKGFHRGPSNLSFLVSYDNHMVCRLY